MGLSPITSRPEPVHDRSTSPAYERGRRSHSEPNRAQNGQGLVEEQEQAADQKSTSRRHPAQCPTRRPGQGSGLDRRAICQGRTGSAPDPLTGQARGSRASSPLPACCGGCGKSLRSVPRCERGEHPHRGPISSRTSTASPMRSRPQLGGRLERRPDDPTLSPLEATASGCAPNRRRRPAFQIYR